MAKQGQHKNDRFDQTKSPGHNHPDRSQTVSTGSPKKQETFEQDAREHRDPNRPAQADRNDWSPERYRDDLNPDPMAGQDRGVHSTGAIGPSAYDVKDTHRLWNGLSDADLKQLPVVPEGTRLEQGAAYFDLNDPNRGEFKARGNMEAGPENRYVAKSAVPYPLWNALIGVENPERLNVGDAR